VRAVRAGAGALAGLASVAAGEVLGWSRRAGYVTAAGDVVVLVGPGVMAGPIHVELAEPLPRAAPPRVALDTAGIQPWGGTLPEPGALRSGLALVASAAASAARASPLWGQRARAAWGALVAAAEWEALVGALGGRGPGLTPAGDDALAGAAFVARASSGSDLEDRLLAALSRTPTNAISLAYLRWAARGQALAPAHDLVCAGAAGDDAAARRAASALGRVGHSSGADFCLGVTWSCAALLERTGVTA